ncbi:JAB domain-containing protein [Candidatus Woesearchaeota archaeon]|nr:JAB domain-containing protein [Candidatus Woesearchaeota archaeon]
MRIKDISKWERPRERFRMKGPDALSNAELLAIILQKGHKGENAIDMSNRIISKFGLDKLSELSLKELESVKGIGEAKAMQIKAIFEINKRVNSGVICERVVNCSEDIAKYYIERMKGLKREHLIAVFLDSKNKIINDKVISIGTLNSSLVHPREVFKEAIKNSANAIILVHNHPSGDCGPSSEDIEITDRIREAGEMVGIKLLDHVIVDKDKHYSYIQKS